MKTSRWKPLPENVQGATRELAEQLRLLVDHAGLTLKQLAAEDHIPHDVVTLRRFFSGQALPPRELVEVIAERCGGDRALLLATLDRAVVASEAGLPWAAAPAQTAPPPRRSLRDRPKLVIAAFAGILVGANAVTAVVVLRLSGRTEAQAAQAVPSPSAGGTSSRAPEQSPTAASAIPVPPPTRPSSRGDKPASRETSGNLIRNGTFTGTTMSWWPVSDVRIRAEDDRLRAGVRGGSTEPWHRIVSAASFPLQYGRTYKLSFDASAGAEITDQVTVQFDSAPYTKALSRRIELTPSTRRFTYRFTANLTTDQAALNVELGGHDTDHTVWLDNVTLVPA